MANRRMLIVYAHPDDESFGLGGLITRYVQEGVEVYLICATNGDAGTIRPEDMNGHSTIAEVRLAELACAAEKLKLKQVFTLGYRDSGMMGSPDNQHPDSLWHQWHAAPQPIIQQIADIMRQVQPQVMITFNKYGGYGHPDHIAIQQATVKALHQVNPSGQPPAFATKLYFSQVARLPIQIGIWRARLKGDNPHQLGRNKDIDIVRILDNIDPATTRIDISDYFEAWDDANACHKSQTDGRLSPRMPMFWRRLLFRYQYFQRVYPDTPTHINEHDLFHNTQATALPAMDEKEQA